MRNVRPTSNPLRKALQLFSESFGDNKPFPDLYKCGNGLTAYSSNALDAPKRIRESGSNRLNPWGQTL